MLFDSSKAITLAGALLPGVTGVASFMFSATTVDSTPEEVAAVAVAENETVMVTSSAVANGDAAGNGWFVTSATFRRETGDVLKKRGATINDLNRKRGMTGGSVDIEVAGNSVSLTVTGEAADAYAWAGEYKVYRVKGVS